MGHHTRDAGRHDLDRLASTAPSAPNAGRTYAGRARYGAPYDVARQLVATGIPDQGRSGVREPSSARWWLGPSGMRHSEMKAA